MTAPTTHLQPTRVAQTFPGLSWEQFEAIDNAFATVPGVKFRYLDGLLEIMVISPEHEERKATLGLLLDAYLRAKRIRFYKHGGPSLGNKALGSRNEPDESYSFGSRKPNPDLAIEIVITSGGPDKLEGYRRLSVPEVWFWEDGVLEIYHLQTEKNAYGRCNRSILLSELPIEPFCQYLTYHDQFDAVDEFLQALGS